MAAPFGWRKSSFFASRRGRFSEILTDFRAKTGAGMLFSPLTLPKKAMFGVHTAEHD